jgi:hypothetical protein
MNYFNLQKNQFLEITYIYPLNKKLEDIFKNKEFFTCQQTHSNKFQLVNNKNYYYQNCDALITTNKNQVLVIKTADCASLLVYDKNYQVACNIHAGWRGLVNGIIPKTLDFIISNLKIKAQNLYIFSPPFIQTNCFEFSNPLQELPKKFHPAIFNNNQVSLKNIIIKELTNLDIPLKNIKLSSVCTKCSKFLPSHRKNKTKERIYSYIFLK